MSSRGGEDLHSTPLYYSRDTGQPEGLRTPGAEIHANTIATLIENRPILEARPLFQMMIAASLALATTFLWGCCRLRFALPATVLTLAAFTVLVLQAFVNGAWVWTVAPLSSAAAALALTLGANYFLEGKEKTRIRNLFKGYVSDVVIAQLLERPEGAALDGERRRIAVLFADIKGFTTISETTEPERVVQLLNAYFGAMIEVIQSHGGTVNCLMGDGVMAVFGAPIHDDDAALHAVQAAQAMMRKLRDVNEHLVRRGFKPIGIGVGINSGEAVIGNMGSPRKMEYTAIGDVVNTASRIEARTRTIPGADILISHQTHASLAGRVPADFVGEAELKGKQTAVALYRVPWDS